MKQQLPKIDKIAAQAAACSESFFAALRSP
jgi:hypothetical protein